MAKYIDLLRAHRPTTAHTPAPPSTQEDNLPFDEMLPSELEPTEFSESTSEPPEKNDLLVDETPRSDEQPRSQEVQLHSKNDWLDRCTQQVLLIFQHAQQEKASDIRPLSQCISELLSQLEQGEQQNIIDELELSISQQTQNIRLIDEDLGSLVQKSILMMLYAIKAGQRLKLTSDELRAHVLAAMLHHIGMAQVPAEIRNKKKRLSKSELAEIKQAPKKGYVFLEQCNVTDPCILQAASQSSERYDGSGEQGLSGTDIAWSARLTSVLSMFEALIHYRPYRARLLPRDAIREIVKHHKKSFDPVMLKALIESISLYPIGTYVQLNSGEIGLVTRIHPRLPLRPIVNIQMDSQGNKIPPRQVDLKNQPNLTIEKCMYEESLSELKSDTPT